MRTSAFLAVAIAGAFACTSGTPAVAAPNREYADALCSETSPPVTINLGLFSKTPLLSVAEHEGYFAQENLTVNYTTVTGSVNQFQQLQSGVTDLIMTAADNVANYHLNNSNALGSTLPVTAVAGTDGGYNLQLFATPGISTVEDLRGKTLGVDAANSGFAYIAYDILAHHGLAAPTKDPSGNYASPDYKIAAIGGVGNRYFNMTQTQGRTRTVDATLLNQGFDILGRDAGLTGLDDVRTVATPYLSGVVAGLTPWLQIHRCDTVRFLRALAGAARFTTDPANAEAVIADIRADQPPFATADYASSYYAVTVTPTIGQFRDLDVDQRPLFNVLDLRQKYSGFDQPQNVRLLSTPAGGLYTNKYIRAAEVSATHRR
ncbi:ABC transporter substrate-binding protein [Micromonospora chersina]|uniref:ABC transporter substrate-binding protein n=1 Tax=Micromonospora chersina TaxID=47854 RepID=UPI003713DDE9